MLLFQLAAEPSTSPRDKNNQLVDIIIPVLICVSPPIPNLFLKRMKMFDDALGALLKKHNEQFDIFPIEMTYYVSPENHTIPFVKLVLIEFKRKRAVLPIKKISTRNNRIRHCLYKIRKGGPLSCAIQVVHVSGMKPPSCSCY